MNAVPFTRIPDAVLLDSRLTPVQFRIYAVIARRADRETASAFPSYATIAKDANISRTSAINGVAALVSFGYLTKRPQESGQGDATSNLYTIGGEGSQIFAPHRPALAIVNGEVVQDMNHGSAKFAPQVVQPVDHGGANAVPEPDSPNQRQKKKTQENRVAPAHTHEASTSAAAGPELMPAFSDFQENIGALTAIARQVIAELVSEFGVAQVREAIQEAVIYEKRSLGYIRRVLSAWKRDGRRKQRAPSAQDAQSSLNDLMPTPLPDTLDLTWPPPDLLEAHQEPPPDSENPAADTWKAISERLPQIHRLMRCVTPRTLSGGVLVAGVSDDRVYSCLTTTQSSLIQTAAQHVIGGDGVVRFELMAQDGDAA